MNITSYAAILPKLPKFGAHKYAPVKDPANRQPLQPQASTSAIGQEQDKEWQNLRDQFKAQRSNKPPSNGISETSSPIPPTQESEFNRLREQFRR